MRLWKIYYKTNASDNCVEPPHFLIATKNSEDAGDALDYAKEELAKQEKDRMQISSVRLEQEINAIGLEAFE